MRRKNLTIIIIYLILFGLLTQLFAHELNQSASDGLSTVANEIPVGVILDMGSWVGKTVHSCITMAVSEFYALNSHYKTRIVLHTRDSKGEPLPALSAVLDLLENIKVQAVMGSETSIEAKFLAVLGDKAKIPIISFTTSPSFSTEYPYFLQIAQDETTQFKGIATLIESFKWKDAILIYEDTETLPYLVDSLQEKDIHIAYKRAVSPMATDDQILEELHKIMTMKTTVVIVHMSPSLVSHLSLHAKRLGLMSGGYAWIITDKTMNFLHSMDSSVIDSMQGALGFKSYIPTSNELHNFTLRWRRKFHMEVMDLNVLGLWAYDAIWALAMAAERVKMPQIREDSTTLRLDLMDLANIRASKSGSILLSEILQTRFKGLSGEFQLINGKKLISKAFEIVNVIGKGDRRVGIWTLMDGITKEMNPSVEKKYSSSHTGLEAIIWPGGSTTTPKGWVLPMSGKKLRIGVPLKQGFHEFINVDIHPQTNATIVTGFCIDVFNTAIDALEYEVPYEFIPFVNANGQMAGTPSDLIYQVYLQNYDAVVGDITITSNRSLYVDFTLPYTDMGVGTVAPVVENKNMWIFLKPLDSGLWITSASFFIITGFVVWAIEHPINEEFQGSPAQQIGTALWFGFSTLVYAQREKLLSNLSRFVVIVWMFVVLILTSSYTATLTSLLTVQQIQLASKGNYIGYQTDSFIQGVIANNLNFEGLKQYSSPDEYADALSKGNNNGGVVAIIDEIPYIKLFLAKYPVGYAMIASEPTTNGFGFVFRKGSPLVPEISWAIAKLREEGKLMMIENDWFKSQSSLMSQDSVTSPNIPNSLDFDSFRGLFLISGISSALALLIFLIFLFHKKWHAHNLGNLSRGTLLFIMKYLSPEKF
ncbi:hypothetical protein F0562_002202 [Nyssa sinensis]|uniref:Glutamate receptor n=1 Tax=Nyssa sinensis TaxID=561372 RepID=A0A5J5C5B2_9ASTE|nr:hypothetical protein F0562_002202 [Nyssa sinensis]